MAFSCRPSELLHLSGIEAYFFDRAVMTFGTVVEAEIEALPTKGKSPAAQRMQVMMVVRKWTGIGQFR